MTENLRLIAKQLTHLQRKGTRSARGFSRTFQDFQEHLGKTMQAVAREEEVEIERVGSVLAFMEKIGVMESADRWKIIREIRNAISHEYEEDAARLTEFFTEMINAAPELFGSHQKLVAFCQKSYDVKPE